jgi:hypothetical protein
MMFESIILRRVFGHKRNEATGNSVKINNEELHNVQASPNFTEIINPKGVRLPGHV